MSTVETQGNVPEEIKQLYHQYDFVPDEVYNGWQALGFPIGAILEWLMVPPEVGNAYLSTLGTDATAHVGAISSIAISEHEEIIRGRDVGGTPSRLSCAANYVKYFFVAVSSLA